MIIVSFNNELMGCYSLEQLSSTLDKIVKEDFDIIKIMKTLNQKKVYRFSYKPFEKSIVLYKLTDGD